MGKFSAADISLGTQSRARFGSSPYPFPDPSHTNATLRTSALDADASIPLVSQQHRRTKAVPHHMRNRGIQQRFVTLSDSGVCISVVTV